jgi:uncharacterized Fe-S radical SAM superfamily protein PflX
MCNDREIESIFHYTTAEGLKGILTSQTLWATDFRYLNDTEELSQAKEIFISVVKPIMAEAIESLWD